jgi:ABC-2 type transport system ATP-binding protein
MWIMDTVVELKNVSKVFRQKQPADGRNILTNLFRPEIRTVHALHNVNLTVRRGEIVAYAGPNGAGKSTTVKMLSGMLVPNAGTVRALGLDPVRDRVKYVGRIGVVFGQRTELWWDMPISASFEWKRVVWDVPDERYHRMLGTVKDLLGLEPFFHSLARELSLGQRMRADLGLALLHEPEILFLDEPTLGLDVLAKRSMIQFIKEINRERHVTVMITSHDMAELEQLAGRIVLINAGQIAFDGDFHQLRREFADTRHLIIETRSEIAPHVPDAKFLRSEGARHEYIFDAGAVNITTLLREAAAQDDVLDVETHRAPIDDVFADIYIRMSQKEKIAP